MIKIKIGDIIYTNRDISSPTISPRKYEPCIVREVNKYGNIAIEGFQNSDWIGVDVFCRKPGGRNLKITDFELPKFVGRVIRD